MKTTVILPGFLFFLIMLFSTFSCLDAVAQADSLKTAKDGADTVDTKKSRQKGWKDEFLVYAGANLNQLHGTSTVFESEPYLGYHIGGAYKRGRFFYWQAGARFNYAQHKLSRIGIPSDSADVVPVYGIDVPITGGINVLSFVNRVLALRFFVSAVPSFNLGVGGNDVGITGDDLNTFMFYGQGGVGVNVAFFLLEAGYNYGFMDQFKNDDNSVPGQFFVNLGFRF